MKGPLSQVRKPNNRIGVFLTRNLTLTQRVEIIDLLFTDVPTLLHTQHYLFFAELANVDSMWGEGQSKLHYCQLNGG